MRQLEPELIAMLEDLDQDRAGLLIAIIPKVAPTVRRVLWSEDIVFEGNTYQADTGAASEARFEAKMTSPGFQLALQNVVDRVTGVETPWSVYFNIHGKRALEGAEVSINIVDLENLDKGSISLGIWAAGPAILDAGNGNLMIRVGMPFDMLRLRTLMPTLGSVTCIWKYKGLGCNSQSPLLTCPKTLPECVKRFPGEPVRYSSWPFLDSMIRRVIR